MTTPSPGTAARPARDLAALWQRLAGRTRLTAASAAPGRRSLPLVVQPQLQTNWCWAACTSSTSAFFAPASTWGQCVLADAEHGQTTCCADGASAACNAPWYLERALRRTGNLRRKAAGAASFATLRAEIDAGRPVGTRIGWRGGGGHFVLLTGYRSTPATREVEVQDPWSGRSRLALDAFATAYKGTGTWTHTYLTEG